MREEFFFKLFFILYMKYLFDFKNKTKEKNWLSEMFIWRLDGKYIGFVWKIIYLKKIEFIWLGNKWFFVNSPELTDLNITY